MTRPSLIGGRRAGLKAHELLLRPAARAGLLPLQNLHLVLQWPARRLLGQHAYPRALWRVRGHVLALADGDVPQLHDRLLHLAVLRTIDKAERVLRQLRLGALASVVAARRGKSDGEEGHNREDSLHVTAIVGDDRLPREPSAAAIACLCYHSLPVAMNVRWMTMPLTAVLAAALAAVVLFNAAAPTAAAQPRLTLISPNDGDVLSQAPPGIHLCFAEPVDNADTAIFKFQVTMPTGSRLGMRIVFQPDGYGVDVQPGLPSAPPEGEWTFEWQVSDRVTKETAEGVIHYQVRPDGGPLPAASPAACTGPETPLVIQPTLPPRQQESGSPAAGTPAAGTPPAGTPAAQASPGTSTGKEDDGGVDALTVAVIVVVAGAAIAGGLFFALSRRRGKGTGPPTDGS